MFQNKRKRRRRGGLIVTLLLFLFTLTTFATATYAWWNTLVATQDQTVKVGNRVTIAANSKTGFNFGSGLVPEGTVLLDRQVEMVTGTIVLNIQGVDRDKDNFDLVIKNNLAPEFQNVFIITYNEVLTNTVDGEHDAVTIKNMKDGEFKVRITIKLDSDQSKYSKILGALVNQDYNIMFTFELVPQTPLVPLVPKP